MMKTGIYLSDIPLHDGSRDRVLALEHHRAERNLKARFEQLNIELQQTSASLAAEKARSEELLYQMLPQNVVQDLKAGRDASSEEFKDVSILFSDIVRPKSRSAEAAPSRPSPAAAAASSFACCCRFLLRLLLRNASARCPGRAAAYPCHSPTHQVGFTVIGSHCPPARIFAMLNELYTKFDTALSEFPELYKASAAAYGGGHVSPMKLMRPPCSSACRSRPLEM